MRPSGREWSAMTAEPQEGGEDAARGEPEWGGAVDEERSQVHMEVVARDSTPVVAVR
jgi:hypothetical protein